MAQSEVCIFGSIWSTVKVFQPQAFEDITLQFRMSTVTNLKFDGTSFLTSPYGNGVLIESSEGVSFDGFFSPSLNFQTALQNELTWTATTSSDSQNSAAEFGQSLAFNSSVDNGAITDLSIQVQIDSRDQRGATFEISRFTALQWLPHVDSPGTNNLAFNRLLFGRLSCGAEVCMGGGLSNIDNHIDFPAPLMGRYGRSWRCESTG